MIGHKLFPSHVVGSSLSALGGGRSGGEVEVEKEKKREKVDLVRKKKEHKQVKNYLKTKYLFVY